MKKFLLFKLLLCGLLSPNAFTQIDYNEIKDQYLHVCGEMDPIVLNQNVKFVDSIAKIGVNSGEELFLQDYRDAYFRKRNLTNNRNDLLVYLWICHFRWEKYQDAWSLFDLAAAYTEFDKVMGLKYILLFEKEIEFYPWEDSSQKVHYEEQINIIKELNQN